MLLVPESGNGNSWNHEAERSQRVGDGAVVPGALRSVWHNRSESVRAKMVTSECIVVPTLLYR